MRISIALVVIAAAIAGCSNDDTSTSSVKQNDPAPRVETDPTPDTGTGGDMQSATPGGTVNRAPDQPPQPAQ
ncbi:hypothetical protein [Mesorhizobium australicum]|uniref:Lipoprotein n=1 Tax=Mesorhizobium australicum TaxID=536018 RepID=A0A1X7PPT6_9HYPH|nr:hypothetical protein [Mesorhizobium australicum]SMH53959.1 hypothetical protein SAMN02982922_4978 [Mesorhizobium australicum]